LASPARSTSRVVRAPRTSESRTPSRYLERQSALAFFGVIPRLDPGRGGPLAPRSQRARDREQRRCDARVPERSERVRPEASTATEGAPPVGAGGPPVQEQGSRGPASPRSLAGDGPSPASGSAPRREARSERAPVVAPRQVEWGGAKPNQQAFCVRSEPDRGRVHPEIRLSGRVGSKAVAGAADRGSVTITLQETPSTHPEASECR
jgi:hypothetical protein